MYSYSSLACDAFSWFHTCVDAKFLLRFVENCQNGERFHPKGHQTPQPELRLKTAPN